MLLDRGQSGAAARVARWDFSAEQAATLYRKTPYGEGFYLEMPWPDKPPARSHLYLFVRYSTKDGRKIEASREINIALPREKGRSWLALNPSENATQPARTAADWQSRPRRNDDSPIQTAAAEESAAKAADRRAEPAARQTPPPRELASSRESAAPRETTASRDRSAPAPVEPASFQAPAAPADAAPSESPPAADPAPAAAASSPRPVW